MLIPLLFSFALIIRGVWSQRTSPLGPVIDLGYISFAGNTTSPTGVPNGPVTFFGAIPYAQPPLGDLRFRAPQALKEVGKSSSVVDARSWGPPCIQRPAVVGIGSEDCLTLNIWKPSTVKQGERLPVMVYIHGGGFYYGTPQGFPMYDWVAQQRIVAVSITYRLGLLGFLGGRQVKEDGDLNAGLLDQRAALNWIQRHISKFGGDPDNVTIVGESAGGASVTMQMFAYGGSRPAPFRRVITQSIGFGPTVNEEQVEQAFNDTLKITGCSGSADALKCLRKSSSGAIVSAINTVPNAARAFAPIIDGPTGFLPDLPSQLIASGKFAPVDFMGGHCSNDGRTFAGGKPEQFNTDSDVRRLVFSRWPGVSNATIDKALELYPSPTLSGSPFVTQYDRAATMAGDIIFTCMDLHIAEHLSQARTKDVYLYRWNAPDTVLYNANPYLGAMHTSDIYFLFSGTNTFGNAGNTFTAFNETEKTLSSEAIAYWTSFGASGNPSTYKRSASPVWPAYVTNSTSASKRLFIDKGSDTTTSTSVQDISQQQIERCKFWMSKEVAAQTRI
ncbi:hypothetical protein CVT24_008474 [Panaeolus cyanescens]|uniref:Carboxylic ester hydrolase n=1 Tax=Panaeolus cyanescens TaxID=181874 RepID=A0A409VBS1_9AGAR|nr:hypothetical protein CVT24_008474 [Panaeolus cyanescens]